MVFYRPQFGRPGHTTTDLDSSAKTRTHQLEPNNHNQGPASPKRGLGRYLFHPIWMKTSISLGLTALALLLLVMVLLSVPGPIKGLYWFSVKGEEGGSISAGVLGWCMTETSNCTYAPLSDNAYLSTMIDAGQALTVRIMLPTACYWLIVTLVCWTLLTVLVSRAYQIKDLDSISRHLQFAVLEACVLCISVFGAVLCWLAFGVGRNAYLSVQNGGGRPESGQAMETTAVAAVISLLSIFTASLGLHIRLKQASAHWKEEATMNRRKSMMSMLDNPMATVSAAGGIEPKVESRRGSKRWSNAPEYTMHGQERSTSSSIAKHDDEEERLGSQLDLTRNTAREQETMIRRASMIGPNDNPYGAGAQAQRSQT